MNAVLGWLALLCCVWAAISFWSTAVTDDDGDATRTWRWVYAFGAVALGLAAYLLPL
jgi:peptidoglycan/LPS O-acetylase OafA/YrhL